MPISQIVTNSIANGAVAPADLSTGAPTWDTSGNVGIGKSSLNPWNTASNGVIQLGNRGVAIFGAGTTFTGGAVLYQTNNAYFDNVGWKYATTNPAAFYEQQNNAHIWYTASSGTADNSLTWSERMRITSTGAISVGSSGTATGTSGQALLSQGSGSPPVWGDVSSIGVGQSWQSFAGSRAIGTTYTNSTGRAIAVCVSVSTSNIQAWKIVVGGVDVAAGCAYAAGGNFQADSMQAIVPNGATYQIVTTNGNGTATVQSWAELR